MANAVLYGFETLETVYKERVSTVGYDVVFSAVQEATRLYNEEVARVLSTFVTPVDWAQQRRAQPGAGTLQPLDDKNNPYPTREEGYYEVALPIQGAGDAWGWNIVSRAKMTVEEVARHVESVQRKDSDWLRRHVLAAIFDNVAWTFTDPGLGSLIIRPLAITADGVVYNRKSGAPATDQHFLAQAGAIADVTNPFPALVEELAEHPSNNVSDANPVIVLYPTNVDAAIKGLADFVPASTNFVIPGSGTDRAEGIERFGTLGDISGTLAGLPVVLRKWDYLPSDYLVAYASGAEGEIVGMRQHPEPELQGLFPSGWNIDGNWEQANWRRFAGFGVINRVGAAVQRVSNGAYAIPTGYDAPLGV